MRPRRIAVLAALAAATVSVTAASQGRAGGGAPIVACGQLVTTSAFLTKNLECPGAHGIVAFASGITIDLKGFRLRGDRTPGRYGIDVPGFDHVTVKNGVVTDFAIGVAGLNGADTLVISKVVASGNGAHGIFVEGTSAKIASSSAVGNAGNGILVTGATATLVQSSIASGNGGNGIFVIGNATRVQSTTASGNAGDGISVVDNAPVLRGNRADGNGFAGGVSDLSGRGITTSLSLKPPVGTNVAHGNDNPGECSPSDLC
jgi:Right handed beta helix region